MTDASILSHEAAHFGTLAADWWDPKGGSAMLHKLNPVRLGYVRAQMDAHWELDQRARAPLAGKRALDAGCGAGLLSEPLARLGAAVTAIDAAPENIAIARAHAAGQGLAIDYRAGGIEQIAGERFDLIVSMEVVEHVAEPAAFVAQLANMLAPGGLMILSTPNRTAVSRLALITVGEGTGMVPRGTHDWSRFLQPEELRGLIEQAGLAVRDTQGIVPDVATGFRLGDSLALDYLMTATAGGSAQIDRAI